MEELLELIKLFEVRNNLSVGIIIFGDGSGRLFDFWQESTILNFVNSQHIEEFLQGGNLKMKDGKSISPIEILNPQQWRRTI